MFGAVRFHLVNSTPPLVLGFSVGSSSRLLVGMPCTQCKLLYVNNYFNPSFGLFSLAGCSITDVFTLFVDGGCGTFELPPFFTHFQPFEPIYARFCCTFFVIGGARLW